MNKIITLSLVTLLIHSFFSPLNAESFKKSGSRSGKSIFPAYRNNNAGKKPIPQKQDVNGNRVTEDHLNRVNFADERAHTVMRNDPHVVNHVAFQSAAYSSQLRPVYEGHNQLIHDHFLHYNTFVIEHPLVWDTWHRHHFYGGFYYGFHPIPDIQVYFTNPLVYWFYVGTWDEAYYHTWYAGEHSAYPASNHAFRYYGVFYPTDNLRQLLFGVSAMPVDRQANFRDEVSIFTQELTQQLANQLRTHVVLSKGDIVVTHYEIIGNDHAVVMEGVINFQNKPYNFKGMMNLENTDSASLNRVQVFIATNSDAIPSPEQTRMLDSLNASVDSIRGEASPVVSAAPEVTQPPVSGDVSADPK